MLMVDPVAKRRFFHPILILSVICAWPWCACFGPLAKRLADKETYGIVKEKQEQLLGKAKPFTIDSTTTTLTRDVLKKAGFSTDQFTTTSLTIGLSDALALSIDNNRDYQTRREALYLAALKLTEERHKFAPIFTDLVTGRLQRQPGGTTSVERFGEAVNNFAITKVFATGARVTVGLTSDFLKVYTGPRPDAGASVLSAAVVQPLLQGAGAGVSLENLVQSERDVIYALRNFERYQRRFIVDRVTQYYRLLQAANSINNEYQAYQRSIVVRERAMAMEDAQRMAAFQVDQARQNEFSARNRWLTSRTDYSQRLDTFKVDLGLPPELSIKPDMADLDQLQKMDLIQLKFDLETAQRMAENQRMDYRTALDRAEDAARDVMIAENSLLPAVNVLASASMPTKNATQPFNFDWSKRSYGAGFSAELPLDRKAERNDYRAALIGLAQSQRDAEQLRNTMIAQVRDTYQDVNQARQSYEIQIAGLKLAERRVDNVQMLMQIGRSEVSIRDQLDAESSLRDARNSVTKVLVDYIVARLEFYHAIEALEINDRGMWKNES